MERTALDHRRLTFNLDAEGAFPSRPFLDGGAPSRA
jgi:hypothetical protein